MKQNTSKKVRTILPKNLRFHRFFLRRLLICTLAAVTGGTTLLMFYYKKEAREFIQMSAATLIMRFQIIRVCQPRAYQ